ncbi:MAG: hypothetical protein IT457_03175 [Planctomycetes bacterium]|nr:hypothetical protein [Planctomycetota bacterium]
MTDQLPELEPMDDAQGATLNQDAGAMGAAAGAPVSPMLPPGLAAPAYNLNADKEYYRFLFSGVVMTIGCLMPFGPEWDMAGYKTLSGALCLVVGIGMIWSWWGAISVNRFRGANLKWVAFSLAPLLIMLFGMMRAFELPAVVDFGKAGKPMPSGWGEFFSSFFAFNDAPSQEKADNFVRAFGSGKFVVFLGAFFAEFSMLLGVFGGAKTARKQAAAAKAARAASSAARKR